MLGLRDLLRFVEEDAPHGDVTSEAIIPNVECEAVIVAKQEGVVAGLEETKKLFEFFGLRVDLKKRDGDDVKAGEVLAEVRGDAKTILLLERTVLNIIGRMSGIATKTRRLVRKVRTVNPKVRVAATRKTCPGLRKLDKKAVAIGGGEVHRLSLSDAILIKDNHLAIVSLEEAITKAKKFSIYKKVEVEVSDVESAVKAAKLGADVIMLDNVSPDKAKDIIDALKRSGLRNKVVIEVSGRIDESNIEEYAKLDVDVISVGALTHSVENFDVSLKVTKII